MSISKGLGEKTTKSNYQINIENSDFVLETLSDEKAILEQQKIADDVLTQSWEFSSEDVVDLNRVRHALRFLGEEKAKARLNHMLLDKHKDILLETIKNKLLRESQLTEPDSKDPSDAKLTMQAKATKEYKDHINGLCYAAYFAERADSDFETLKIHVSFYQTLRKSKTEEGKL